VIALYNDAITLKLWAIHLVTLSEIRDEFQQRLLTSIYRGSDSSSLVLKGGAAMRVLTASARYTQDLDFDHDPHRSLASLQTTMRSAIERALRGSGLVLIAVSEPKQTDTVARWKISARTGGGEALHLAVEVSHRRTPDLDHVLRIPIQISDRTLPRVYVSVYDERALADNKVAALLDDRRVAPRDIYDLELLLARGVCPSAAMVEQSGGRTALIRRLSDKLELMNWSLFRDQVLPTLPREIQVNIDEDAYLATKIRLLEALDRCLSAPAELSRP
jgi:predicted nucleotidyltransferase component of viral defense system